MNKMQIGKKVKTKGYFAGLEGEVTGVGVGHTDEDHGFIRIRVTANTRPKFWSWVRLGDEESFVYYRHEKHLEEIS